MQNWEKGPVMSETMLPLAQCLQILFVKILLISVAELLWHEENLR